MKLPNDRCRFLFALFAFAIALVGVQSAYAIQPCCGISAINTQTGVVTAKVNATSQTFQFRLNEASQVKSLKVGQAIYANLSTKQVSLDGKTTAGIILSATKAAPLDGIKLSAAPLDGVRNSAAPLDGFVTKIDVANSSLTCETGGGQTFDLRLDNAAPLRALAAGKAPILASLKNPNNGTPVHFENRCGPGSYQYDYQWSGYGGAHCPSGYYACVMPITGQTSEGRKVCGSTIVCVQHKSDCNPGQVLTNQQP